MAATALTVHTLSRAALDTSATVASNAVDGNTVGNNGKVWIEVNNTDTGPHTLTVAFAETVDGQVITPRTYTVAASTKGKVGPWPVAQYGSSVLVTTGNVLLQLAAYKLGV